MMELSIKSSLGQTFGKRGSNARGPLHAAVEDKTIDINGKEYSAKDAVDAAMFIYSELMRFATEGHIVGEKREIVIKPQDMGKFDKELADDAIKLGGKAGSQIALLRARKITKADIVNFRNSSLYKDRNISPERKEVIEHYLTKMEEVVEANQDFRLIDTQDIFTGQIVDIFEKTDSSLRFESDLIAVKFNPEGFEGLTITPAEVMRARAEQVVGDIGKLSVLEQLKKLGSWRLGTRGLNTHNKKTRQPMGGYAGAIINMSPPASILKREDKMSPKDYVTYIQTQGTPTSKVG